MVERIIVATTHAPGDEPLRSFLRDSGFEYFAGSEEDVLDRFYQAAKQAEAEVIVRITPDDPFKDPLVIDRAIRTLHEPTPVDYASNCSYDGSIPATFPEGIDVEVLTFDCLERLWNRASLASEREHLTPYIFSHPDEFRVRGFQHSEPLSHLRWTIDYERDLAFAREIYGRLYPGNPLFGMEDVLDVLRREPELSHINQGTVRYEGYLKSVNAEKPS